MPFQLFVSNHLIAAGFISDMATAAADNNENLNKSP
jgi:hypothetical protein